jgi:hypothetical protein
MLQEVELQDGQMDHELSTRTTAAEQLMVLGIAHRPGHQAPRLQHTGCRTVLHQARRHPPTVEEIHGALKPRPTNRNNISPTTTVGKINLHQTAGVPMPMMLRHQARICLLLLRQL